MTSSVTYTIGRNTLAVAMTFGSVVLFSLFPVLIALWGTGSPFLFASVFWIGSMLGLLVFLLTGYRTLVFNGNVWRLVWRHTLGWTTLILTLSPWNAALFAWSAGLIDISITSILYELNPVILIFLTGRLLRSQERFRRIGPFTTIAFGFAVIGVAAVVLSQGSSVDALKGISETPSHALVLGILLALCSAGLASLLGLGFKWGTELAVQLPKDLGHGSASLEVFGVVVAMIICNLIAIPGIAMIGFARNEAVVPSALVFGLLGALVVGSLPSILWRKANLITDNLGINVMLYFTPLLSLVWLFTLSLVGDVDVLLLLFGAVVIVAANIIVIVEGRQAFRSSDVTSLDDRDIIDIIASGETDSDDCISSMRRCDRTSRTTGSSSRLTSHVVRPLPSLAARTVPESSCRLDTCHPSGNSIAC